MSNNVEQLQQHIMTDVALLKRIADYASIKAGEIVLEIGAGPGNLTELLVQKAKEVFAFEIDFRFKLQLAKLEKKYKNLHVSYEDALKAAFPENFDKLVANIPYNMSEPLLMKLIDCNFELAVLTVGDTFANILTKRDSTSRLSIIAPAYFDVEIKELVPKDAFEPQPRTKSAVIVLIPKTKEALRESPELFITRELWQQRTKKTINAMREAIINIYTLQHKIKMTKNQARDVLAKIKLDSKLAEKTIETLSGKEFANLLEICSGIDFRDRA